MEEVHRARYRKWCIFHASHVHHSPPVFVCLPTQEQSEPCSFGVFMRAPLHRHAQLKYWPLVLNSISSPSFLPEVERGGGGSEKKFPPSNQVVGPLATNSHPHLPRSFPKNHLINKARHLYYSHNLRNSSCVPGKGRRPNIDLLSITISHSS